MERPPRVLLSHKPIISIDRIFLSLIAFTLGLFVCACALASKPVDNQGITVLANFSIPHNTQTLRLGISPCQNNVCKISLQLVKKGSIVNQLPLQWHTGSFAYTKADVGRWYGAGDPIDDETQYQSWTVGQSEHDFVVVTTQPVTLAADVQGILVHQTVGFEHTRRHHSLFIVQKDQLVRAWQQTEGPGPVWSTVLVADDKSPELIYFEFFFYGDSSATDSLTIQYLTWNGKTQKLQTCSTGQTTLYYVTLTPFNDIAAARVFQQQLTCLGNDYLLLSNTDIRTEEKIPSKFSFTAVTHSEKLAQQFHNTLKTCLPADSGKTVKVYRYK